MLCWILVAAILLLAFPRETENVIPENTYVAKEAIYQEKISGEAVLCYSSLPLLADEGVFDAPEEGEKVGKGQAIFTYYPDTAQDTLAELKRWEAEWEIAKAREAVTKELLWAQIKVWREALVTGQNKDVAEERLSFLLSAYQGKARYKKAELAQYIADCQEKLPAPIKEDTAPTDGYFFLSLDGYEEIWDNLSLPFSAEDWQGLREASPKKEGDAKLICDFQVTVVMRLSPKELAKLEKGKVYPLTLLDGTLLSATLSHTDATENGEIGIATFSAMMPPTTHLPKRIQSATLLVFEQYLLRVPKEAVSYEGEQAYVLVWHGERVLARAIDVAYQTKMYCYLLPALKTVSLFGEDCRYLKANEAVILNKEDYTHREVLK